MVDNTFKQEAFKQSTDEVILELLTISHEDFSSDLRLVRNNENIVSQGDTFIASQFDLTWPQDREGEAPRASLKHQNISRELVAVIRGIRTPPSITMQVILASDPNTVQFEVTGMVIGKMDYDANTIQFELTFEIFSQTQFPGKTFNPAKWTGLF